MINKIYFKKKNFNPNRRADFSIILIISLFMGFFPLQGLAQGRVHDRIAEIQQRSGFGTRIYNPFKVSSQVPAERLSEAVTKYILLEQAGDKEAILNTKPENLRLAFPVDNGSRIISVLLFRTDISPNGFTLITSDGKVSEQDPIVHYRGIIENNPVSLASFSFSNTESMGLISSNEGNYVLGKIENDASGIHMIYNDAVLIPGFMFDCNTDVSVPQNYKQVYNPNGSNLHTLKCVDWYWEVDYDIFVGKGSLANVNTYMQGIFNQVSTLYSNDGIDISLQTLYVWTSVDPYTGPSTSNYLSQFGSYRTSFAGDLANLMGYQGSGGIAYLDGLCGSTQNKMGYCGISSSYQTVPTYSWTVEVVAHEEGHLLGSRHTHDCAWNGNNTRIDGCGPAAGYSTGSCGAGPIPVKGTIMSYCHLSPNPGINLALGFGPQPTALMIDNINNASCLGACTSCTPPSQPGTITGSTNPCQGLSQVYSVTPVAGATSYSWTLPSGWGGSSTTNSISAIAGNNSGTVSVTANNSCGTSTARTLTVSVANVPAQPDTITVSGGTTRVCPGNTRTYTAPFISGVTYTWVTPTGAVINSGQGTNSINVTYNSNFTSNGTLYVSASNSCGSSAATSLSIIRNNPGTPGAMSGIYNGLCGVTNAAFSVPNVSGYTYTWTVPSGVNIVSGQNTNSIVASFPSTYLSGSVSVIPSNACGSGNARSKIVKTVPAAPGVISGTAEVCPNSNGNPFNVNPVPNASTYRWAGPVGSHISDGTTTSNGNYLITPATAVTVNLAAVSPTSVLKVKAINTCGSGLTRKLTLIPISCREGSISEKSDQSINVYPNPASDYINIEFNSSKVNTSSVEIIDIIGKTVLTEQMEFVEGNNNFEVNVSGIPSGIYMVKVNTADNELFISRIIVR
jgi:hypothetical protein